MKSLAGDLHLVVTENQKEGVAKIVHHVRMTSMDHGVGERQPGMTVMEEMIGVVGTIVVARIHGAKHRQLRTDLGEMAAKTNDASSILAEISTQTEIVVAVHHRLVTSVTAISAALLVAMSANETGGEMIGHQH